MEFFEVRNEQQSVRASWPFFPSYAERFRVPDILPKGDGWSQLKAVFIGESPHRDEVAPKDPALRSPFRGVAGREWWEELVKIAGIEMKVRPVPARPLLENLCQQLRIGVLNAVQYPIDPKITLHQGDASTPRTQLGFEKGAGDFGYKAVVKQSPRDSRQGNPVQHAILDLAFRLSELAASPAQVVCLGNDSRWFVERAMERLPEGTPLAGKPLITIPHPSSWWRNAAYRARAVGTLQQLLGSGTGGAA